MKRNLLFLFVNLFLINFSNALTALPKNSYLQIGDNLKEVRILQQILNSDMDTEVVKVGPGSPGNENWYFGKLTEVALKKFQEKNGLEPTGRIDFKTWKSLNNYVLGPQENTPESPLSKRGNTSATQDKINSANQINKTLNTQNKKDFEAAKKTEIEKNTAEKAESKSYIQSLIDKTTSFFYDNNQSATSTAINQNPKNSDFNPYLNQQTQIQPQQQFNPNQYTFGQNSPYSNNPYSGQQPQNSIFGNNLPLGPGGPTPMKRPDYGGIVGGALPGKFRILPDGWLAGPTTHFGTEWNGGRDAAPGSNCNAAMSTAINICSVSTCIVALPIAAQVYFWGNPQQKSIIGSILGQSANSQYKSLGWSYGPIKGSAIEIVNLSNNGCTVAPIWETGPDDTEGGAIDLTPCIKKAIGPSTNFISKFRPVKQGARGCEGYEYIPSLIK